MMEISKSMALLGVYNTRMETEVAVTALKAEGFERTNISVLLPDNAGSQEFLSTKLSRFPDFSEGGTRALPAEQWSIGGVGDAMLKLGISDYDARRYEGYVKNGGIIISVQADNADQIETARLCMERTGAEDIASTEDLKEDWQPYINHHKEEANPDKFHGYNMMP